MRTLHRSLPAMRTAVPDQSQGIEGERKIRVAIAAKGKGATHPPGHERRPVNIFIGGYHNGEQKTREWQESINDSYCLDSFFGKREGRKRSQRASPPARDDSLKKAHPPGGDGKRERSPRRSRMTRCRKREEALLASFRRRRTRGRRGQKSCPVPGSDPCLGLDSCQRRIKTRIRHAHHGAHGGTRRRKEKDRVLCQSSTAP